MKKLIAMLIVVACGSMAYGDSKVGTSAAQFLKLGSNAISAGMGDTGAAMRDGDASTAYYNPAALDGLSAKSVSFLYASWVEGITYQYAAYAQPTKFGTLGVAVQYLSYGSIPQTDDTGLDIGTFSPSDMCGTITYASNYEGFNLGANVKY